MITCAKRNKSSNPLRLSMKCRFLRQFSENEKIASFRDHRPQIHQINKCCRGGVVILPIENFVLIIRRVLVTGKSCFMCIHFMSVWLLVIALRALKI
jgi:hypothetical protein